MLPNKTLAIPSLTPQLIVQTVAFVVAQVVAFGILDAGTAQTIIAVGGIVIPAAFAIAQALHLGRVHAAVVQAATTPPPVAVKPAPAKPAGK